ncbi:MAG: SH3 domain-containing protein [Eubacterium sp.]|nr:SH3 domain-containing protein [Eubacterium sp.]
MRKRAEKYFKKLSCLSLILFMVGCLASGYQSKNVQAADTAFEKSIASFPESYKSYLRTLHIQYPNWKFVAYNTGIDFQTAVNAEFTNDRSLIENSFSKLLKSNELSSNYNASTGAYIAKDGGRWVAASKNCIAYFMDPRNFLDVEHIYMFEKLSFDSTTQTQAGVEAILEGSFMHNTKMAYLDKAGKYYTTNTLYSAQIMATAKKNNVSAYYIASKIIQEIGIKKHSKYAGMGGNGSVNGNYSKTYAGIYNFYNIGASSGADPVSNGLKWASSGSTYSRPWTTPMNSIDGGAKYIGETYINAGQNTIYYQRFNVNKASKNSIYTHQYMTNIYGAANEAALTCGAYENLGITALAKTFVIPVYSSMPDESNTITYGNTTTRATISSAVNVRKKANTSGELITTLAAGDAIYITKAIPTSAKFGTRWLGNPYWYKIKTTKGGKTYEGYISSAYATVDKEYNVAKGGTITLPVKLKTKETVYYRSDNPAIATVDSAGKITGKALGTVTMYAFTAAGQFAVSSVQVGVAVEKPSRVVMKAKPISYQSVKLSWAKKSNLTGYYIYRKIGNEKYKRIAKAQGTAKSYKDQKLAVGTTYVYKMKAYRVVGQTTYKSKNSKAVTAKPMPKKTKMTSAVLAGNAINVSWKKVNGATGYDVYRRTGTTGSFVKVKSIAGENVCSFSDTKTAKGKVYYYKVKVYNNYSGKTYRGKSSKAISIKK